MVRYCQKCVSPEISAVPMGIDEDGICTACRVSEQVPDINWDDRWQNFVDLTNSYKSENNYDIIVPVSGGKDSYYQVHVVTKELGLKPLLVTYYGNNYLPEGEYNLHRMKEVFDCDHIIVHPSVDTLIKMNRLGLKVQGDNNWHAHCGIFTVPIQVAVRYKVPLILWGEHGFMDLGKAAGYLKYCQNIDGIFNQCPAVETLNSQEELISYLENFSSKDQKHHEKNIAGIKDQWLRDFVYAGKQSTIDEYVKRANKNLNL